MRSYDYCHFEVVLGINAQDDQSLSPQTADELRKEAARLADKAVEQYKTARLAESRKEDVQSDWRLKEALAVPEGERTPEQKARIKYAADEAFHARFGYDYEDDWGDPYKS